MRAVQSLAAPLVCFCLLAAPAAAAELTSAEVKELVSGKTLYIETTATSATSTAGKGVLYYAADGSVLFKTPSGAMWHGAWAIKGNANCTDWKETPNNPCTKYDNQGGTVSLINSATGQVRAKIVKTAPGNAENLAP